MSDYFYWKKIAKNMTEGEEGSLSGNRVSRISDSFRWQNKITDCFLPLAENDQCFFFANRRKRPEIAFYHRQKTIIDRVLQSVENDQ